MAVPLYDAAGLELPRGHPARKPVAILGMRRDAGYIDAEVAATARRVVPLFLLVVVGVALVVWFALRQTVVRPLRRLVEGIDAVAKGDLSRVILAERDDEIGTIAGRFNAMTGSLREAREEGERGAERPPGAGGAAAPVGEAGDHRPDGGRDRPRGGHAAQRHRRARARR